MGDGTEVIDLEPQVLDEKELAKKKKLANLGPYASSWKKGQSINPGGYSKKSTVIDQESLLMEMVIPESIRQRFMRARGKKHLNIPKGTTVKEVLALRAVALAMEGDYRFFRDLMDRHYGKPVARIEGRYLTAKVDGQSTSKEKLLELLSGNNDDVKEPENG